MKNKTLISVRSNCDFSLNYETGKLHPQTEVILITTSPNYVVNKKKGTIQFEYDRRKRRYSFNGVDYIEQVTREMNKMQGIQNNEDFLNQF